MTSDEDLVRRLAADINARLDPAADLTVTADLEQAYRSAPRVALLTLRQAFTLDRDDETQPPRLRTFCQSRLDLITRVLAAPVLTRRREGSTGNSPPRGGLAETHGGD